MAEMVRRQDLRALGINSPIANPHLVDAIHQFGDEVELKAGAAEGRDAAFGRENYLRILDCEIKVILSHVRKKIRRGRSYSMHGSLTGRLVFFGVLLVRCHRTNLINTSL